MCFVSKPKSKQLESPKERIPVPDVQFDALLDDVGLLRLFDQLDDKILNHVANFNSGDVLNLKKLGGDILHEGGPLLERNDSRLSMLRALFAYHIYGLIVDWTIFTDAQKQILQQVPKADHAAHCASFCRRIDNEKGIAAATKKVEGQLEQVTKPYVPTVMLANKTRQASLQEIARSVVLITLRLGLQRDLFEFAFRNKDSTSKSGKPLHVTVLGMRQPSAETYEAVNSGGSGGAGTENIARAMMSPGVYRCSARGKRYMVRRMKIFMAPLESTPKRFATASSKKIPVNKGPSTKTTTVPGKSAKTTPKTTQPSKTPKVSAMSF